MGLFDFSGAGKGMKEYKEASNLRRMDTGARANDEAKKKKRAAKIAARAARQAAKGKLKKGFWD
jgi:hypothetical protein